MTSNRAAGIGLVALDHVQKLMVGAGLALLMLAQCACFADDAIVGLPRNKKFRVCYRVRRYLVVRNGYGVVHEVTNGIELLIQAGLNVAARA
jgi:hypothetical protein